MTATSVLGLNIGSMRRICRNIEHESLSALSQRLYMSQKAVHSADYSQNDALSCSETTAGAKATGEEYELAEIIAHNLTYQHAWTSLSFTEVPSRARAVDHSCTDKDSHATMPLVLVSGYPPERIYVHPDQQLAELEEDRGLRKKQPSLGDKETKVGETKAKTKTSEAMYVLPTRKRHCLYLQQLGDVFDAILIPSLCKNGAATTMAMNPAVRAGADADFKVASLPEWERTKRLLLAVLDDDSTVAYYILHDGIIKPRQN